MPARTLPDLIVLPIRKPLPSHLNDGLAPEVAMEIANLVVAMGGLTEDDFRIIVKVVERLEVIQLESGREAALLAARKISEIILGGSH